MKEKLYIICAEYSQNMPYYIAISSEQKIFMEKLRPFQIMREDFGYTLEEAENILKMYKAYSKKKMKSWNTYQNSFVKMGVRKDTGRPYLATNYFLIRKTKLIKRIEVGRNAIGEKTYKWTENGR